MCACTRLRMSVMARCAATPRICDSANPVIAVTTVAPAAASAIGTSRSDRPLPSTSSTIHLGANGRTSCDMRLTSMRTRPIVSRRRWAQTSCRASRQAAEADTLFFF